MKAINIKWDVDNEEDLEFLPAEIELPDGIEADEIEDYLSNVTGFCHKGYELEAYMDKRVEYLLDEIEKLGFDIEHIDEDEYMIGKYSPCGQDCNAYIYTGDDAEVFVANIRKYAYNYDVSHEAYMWLDDTGHGTNGAPYDMRDVYEDMEWWKESLEELADELDDALKDMIDKYNESGILTIKKIRYFEVEVSDNNSIDRSTSDDETDKTFLILGTRHPESFEEMEKFMKEKVYPYMWEGDIRKYVVSITEISRAEAYAEFDIDVVLNPPIFE